MNLASIAVFTWMKGMPNLSRDRKGLRCRLLTRAAQSQGTHAKANCCSAYGERLARNVSRYLGRIYE